MKFYQYFFVLFLIIILFYFGFCWKSLSFVGEDEMQNMAMDDFIGRQHLYYRMLITQNPSVFEGVSPEDSEDKSIFYFYESSDDIMEHNPECCRYYHYSSDDYANRGAGVHSNFEHVMGFYKGQVILNLQARWVDELGNKHSFPFVAGTYFSNCGVSN